MLDSGAFHDPHREREFSMDLTTIDNVASYQITTELLPFTVYESCLQTTAGDSNQRLVIQPICSLMSKPPLAPSKRRLLSLASS